MAFFKFRQRGQPQPEPRRRGDARAAEPQETIDSMRRRARHRLVGAAVLVLVAVIGFPLLFDTQPRPVVVDAPITIPDKDKLPPLRAPAADSVPARASLDDKEEVLSPAPKNPVVAQASTPPVAAKPAAPAPETRPAVVEPPARPAAKPDTRTDDARAAEEAAREAARVKREQEAEARAKRAQETQAKRDQDTQARREQEAQARREQEVRAKREAEETAKRQEAARARALLEGRGTAGADAAAAKVASDSGRFIIQVGAFADADKAREVRQQAERAGVKTYVQVVDTAQGKRTRVRVGPYASRAEAEKAAAALKKAGLSGAILSL
ncbi:MAG: SPOR domain-containing protein [Burkholderiales bacterium]|nr:SPOR domain-containing protein [Burkholderiales bacterium]